MSDINTKDHSRSAAGIFGVILILTGCLFFVGNFVNFLSIDKLWPLFIMIPVVFFIPLLFQDFKANYGVVMPGTLLTFLTVYFLWLNYTSWDNVGTTWPNFILAPAAGLFALYLTNRERGILIPVFILGGIAAAFYGMILHSTMLMGICFVGGGVLLLLSMIPVGKKKA